MSEVVYMRKLILIFLVSALTCLFVVAQQPADSASAIVEQGKFTLHKFEQPIGQESYEIRRDGAGARLRHSRAGDGAAVRSSSRGQ